jgi:hypothetical protein
MESTGLLSLMFKGSTIASLVVFCSTRVEGQMSVFVGVRCVGWLLLVELLYTRIEDDNMNSAA